MIQSQRNTPARFDPFTDRRSRDIRNGLSQAFVDALDADNDQIYHRVARKWLTSHLPVLFETYVRERLERYDRIMTAGGRRPMLQPYATALDIWNLGLFFEFHEYLETIWRNTSGAEHRALKGLIKAAGVYVHLENNNRPAARRLASKARQQLVDDAHCLSFIANLDVLLERLERLELQPPPLEYAG